MRFVLVSDTHGETPALPPGDVLVLAGDVCPSLGACERELAWLSDTFYPWLEAQPHRYKVLIAGNHDFPFEQEMDRVELPPGVTYLCDSGATVGGIRVHGSPRTPRFGNWAFMHDESQLSGYWDLIPGDVQVLITHGPPFGLLDMAPDRGLGRMTSVGSKTLAVRLGLLPDLRLHVFGHIHEGYGTVAVNGVTYANVSHWDGPMRAVRPPVVLDL